MDERVYKRRFFVLGIYFISVILLGFNTICFTSMNDVFALLFNVSKTSAHWLTIGAAVGEATTIITISVFVLWKAINFRRWTIMMTSAEVLCYALLLCAMFFKPSVIFAVVGQMIMGAGGALLESNIALVVGVWFSENEYARFFSAIWVGKTCGYAFASLLSSVILPIKNYQEIELEELSNTRINIAIIFISMFAVTIVLTMCSFAFLENKPPLPPSKSAADRFFQNNCFTYDIENYRISVIESANLIQRIFIDFTAFSLFTIFGLCYMLFIIQFTLTTNLIILTDQGRTLQENNQTSTYITLALWGGCFLGGVLGGRTLDKLKRYNMFMIASSVGTLISAIVSYSGMAFNLKTMIYIGSFGQGFFLLVLLVVSNDSALQHLYPIEEISIGMLLIFVGNVFTYFIPLGFVALLKNTRSIGFVSLHFCILFTIFVLSCILNVKKTRLIFNESFTENDKLLKDVHD